MEWFHVLNRGVDKRVIFLDDADRLRFIHNLFEFNDTKGTDPNVSTYFKQHLTRPGEKKRDVLVHVHAFALMPNHYHLLLSPVVEGGISLFMKKVNMGYAKYFNEKNKRVGALFQGKYKSILMEHSAHFMYIPYYIHFNPLDLSFHEWRTKELRSPKDALAWLATYKWSSHLDYLGQKNFPQVTERRHLLEILGGENGYQNSLLENLESFQPDDAVDALLEPNER